MKIPDPKLRHFIFAALILGLVVSIAAAYDTATHIPSEAPPRTSYCCSR